MRGSIKRTVVLVLVAAGAGVFVYKALLTDEARQSLKRGAQAVRNTVETVNEALAEKQNVDKDELSNRKRTQEQWDALGIY